MHAGLKPLRFMSEGAGDGGEGEGGNGGGNAPTNGGDGFKAITSQEEFDRMVADRVKRAEASTAKKFEGFDDFKAKADEFDKFKASNQSEAEKAAERMTKLEQDLADERLANLRRRIANEHKITDADDISLFLTGSDEETLTAQAKRLSDREADRKKNNNRVTREGTSTGDGKTADEETREFARNLLGGGGS